MKPHKDEIQIEANHACPMVNGDLLAGCSWYRVTPDKVTVAWEYDIRDVFLSNLPIGYDDERESPNTEAGGKIDEIVEEVCRRIKQESMMIDSKAVSKLNFHQISICDKDQ